MNSTVLVRTNAQTDPSIILFGRDDAGKPRASWFDAGSAELAAKAAGLMKMRVLQIETDEQKAVARQLAPGRVFASGRAFTPFARATVFSKLVELAGGVGTEASETAASGHGSAADGHTAVRANDHGRAEAHRPADFSADSIQAVAAAVNERNSPCDGQAAASGSTGAASGSAVPDAPKRPQDWDEIGVGSLVLATVGVEDGWWESIVIGANGDSLTLKWRDFPREPTFVQRRTDLALLPAAR